MPKPTKSDVELVIEEYKRIGPKVFANLYEPIREVWIHDEGFAASRLSMMRIMARRTKAATVMA
jgi:hypothetical protein